MAATYATLAMARLGLLSVVAPMYDEEATVAAFHARVALRWRAWTTS